MKTFIIILSFLLFYSLGYAQAPNTDNFTPLSPISAQSSKLSSVPVNIFTGVPIVNVPLYSYKNNSGSLGWNLSLSYFAGGIQVGQANTQVGLGWFLNATGAITRTVRGVPDDIPGGYLNTSTIPTDFRSNGNNFYDDTTDTQQDIYEFNCNGRTGKFIIGKDQTIILTEKSKLKITAYALNSNGISGFRIVNENGVKYDFTTIETTTLSGVTGFTSGYAGYPYISAWNLTQIISPFNTDTIKFNYTQQNKSQVFGYPQTTFVKNSDGTRPYTYAPSATVSSTTNAISSILLPNGKTISFVYGTVVQQFFDINGAVNPGGAFQITDTLLKKINISDTTLRMGYIFDYLTPTATGDYRNGIPTTTNEVFLKSVTPFTANGTKKGYSFSYMSPTNITDYTIPYKKDYWGFYNNAQLPNPPNLFPLINGYTWGVSRNPNITYATANALFDYYLPDGGYINYQYELNDHYSYIKTPITVSINAAATSQNSINLNQVLNSKHLLSFNIASTVSRAGTAPIYGDGIITCTIMDVTGTTLYATTSFSLYDLFALGIKTWSFNLPNDNYLLQTQLSPSTTISGAFPVNITWENKHIDNANIAAVSGGLRVKTVTHRAVSDDPTNAIIETYKYITEDGKSSGFLGDIPKYDFPYQENVTFKGSITTTSYTGVSSDPINTQDYSQGGPVGYSRVEVISGTPTHNIGKTVYEFTGLADVNSNVCTSVFPYAPQQLNDWGWGLPKRVSVYDSSNNLVKRTTTTFAYDSTLLVNDNFKSLKLGKSASNYNGSVATTPISKTYLGQEYYPSTGRVYPVYITDTVFQKDGSINAGYKSMVYDTNYNVSKIITSYDKTRGLQLENRLYYPYNYSISGANNTPGVQFSLLTSEGIITPVVATESWITGDANPRLLSTNITDLQVINGYVKPVAVYSLQNNNPVSQSAIGNFNPTRLIRDNNLIKAQQTFTAYDAKGNLLETQSPTTGYKQRNSVIMDYGNQYAVAKVSNAGYTDIAYTSFESDGNGNWVIGSPVRDSATPPVTGRRSYNLSNGGITTSNGLFGGTAYLISVWAFTGAIVYVNGSYFSSTPIAQQNGWSLYSAEITGVSSVSITGSGLIDELRLHPKDSYMSTATYNPMIGITSSNDALNQIIYYEYDYLNRLSVTRDKNKNIIKKYEYSDASSANPIVNTSPNWVFYNINWHTDCSRDSVLQDANPNSPTYNTYQTFPLGINICLCPYSGNYPPMYKIVNGVCQAGVRINTSTTYMKVISINNTVSWVWRCIYHYTWSDGTISTNYTEDNSYPCSLGGGGVI